MYRFFYFFEVEDIVGVCTFVIVEIKFTAPNIDKIPVKLSLKIAESFASFDRIVFAYIIIVIKLRSNGSIIIAD